MTVWAGDWPGRIEAAVQINGLRDPVERYGLDVTIFANGRPVGTLCNTGTVYSGEMSGELGCPRSDASLGSINAANIEIRGFSGGLRCERHNDSNGMEVVLACGTR